MRHLKRATAALLLAALAAPSLAAPAAPDPTALIASGEQLRARLDTASSAAAAPTLKGADGPLIRAAFDAQTIRTMPLDLQLVGNACVAIGQAIVAYTQFAVRATAGEPNARAAADALLVKLQDEMTLGGVAANLCVGRGFVAVLPVVEKMSPAERAGAMAALGQIRDGAMQTLEGTLASMAELKLTPANQRAMVAAALESGATMAPSLPAADRQKVRKQVLDSMARAAPGVRPQLGALAEKYGELACNAVCATLSGN